MTRLQAPIDPQQRRTGLARWYRSTRLGRRLREQVMADMRVILDEWFGYHMVIIGADADIPVNEMTRVQHLTHILPHPDAAGHGDELRHGTILALDEELPLATESIDVVVLVNALEISDAPHQLLREVHRVLTPHGHLLVVGSNANSIRGLWRSVHRLLRGGALVPPQGPSASKLEDWLHLLDFAVAPVRHKLVLPAAAGGRLGNWLERADRWLVDHNIPLGSAFVLYANKTVRGHIQPKAVERSRARLIGLPVAKPVVGARESAQRNWTDRGPRRNQSRDHLRPIE